MLPQLIYNMGPIKSRKSVRKIQLLTSRWDGRRDNRVREMRNNIGMRARGENLEGISGGYFTDKGDSI